MNWEPFNDERLAPQENKAVEMLRNGFTRADICDELDIDRKHLGVLFYNARRKGVDVPTLKAGQRGSGRKPCISIRDLVALHDKLGAAGMYGEERMQAMCARTGLSANCIKVRLWRWKKGIGPRCEMEGQAA